MDAEVEEMTRDRRNNILIHGLPVQVRTRLSPGDIRITLTFSLIYLNLFMPGGPKINLLFFDFLKLIAKKITPFVFPLFTR